MVCSLIGSQYYQEFPKDVLGPLLFLHCIDDIHHCLTHSSIQMFADDIALYKEITSLFD